MNTYYAHRQNLPTHELRSGDQIVIRNTTYIVERVLSREGHIAHGWFALATLMKTNDLFAQLTLRRPRGTALHVAMLTDKGILGSLTRI